MDGQRTTLYPYANTFHHGYDEYDGFEHFSSEDRPHPDDDPVHLYAPPEHPTYAAAPARPRNFRGVGPKGYSRSDQNIKEDICEHLTEDADVDATNIDVDVRGGVVELSGAVSERRQKFRAEYLADAVRGVRDVLNHLQIDRQRDGGPL